MKRSTLILATLALCALPTLAQARDVATWELVSLNVHRGAQQQWILHTDLHARRMEGRFQSLVRPGLGYQILPGLTGWVGYTWVPVWKEDALHTQQDVWEQLHYGAKVAGVGLSLRARLEERFDETEGGVGLRGRVLGRAGVHATDTLELVLWDEAFASLNDQAWAPGGFNENRAFVGPAVHFDHGRVELGYMNRYVEATGTDSHTVITALMLSY